MSYASDAEALYEKNYKGRGLAPKHVIAVKEIIAKALRKGDKPGVAVKSFLKEKGVELKDKPAEGIGTSPSKPKVKEKAAKKPAKEEPKSEKKSEKQESKKTEKLTVFPSPPLEVSKMDRKSLKATLADLDRAGVKVEWSKKDDDNTLKAKVNAAMEKLATPDVMAVLENLDPKKLKDVLNKDCLGLYIDLKSPHCVGCVDNQDCLKQFVTNLKGDFSMFKDALVTIRTEEKAADIESDDDEPEEEKEPVKVAKGSSLKVKKIVYDAKRPIYVCDIENPNKKGEDGFDLIKDVLEDIPSTMKEMRKIAEKHYEVKSDSDFVDDFVVGLRDLGVIKFADDFTEDEKKEMREAGIEIE